MDDFKQKGMFSLSEFESISFRSDASIYPFQFARLLEILRIAAPFQTDGEIMYFFPCVLAHSSKKMKWYPGYNPISSLLITFKCGYCPKGVAGSLIKYLITNEMKSSLSWKLRQDHMYRDWVSFKVGPLGDMWLKTSPTHFEIRLFSKGFQNCDNTCPVGNVCYEVRKAVSAGIRQVTSDINYVNAQHSFTFCCGYKDDHPGVLEFVDGN